MFIITLCAERRSRKVPRFFQPFPMILAAVVGFLWLFGSLPRASAEAPALYNFSGADGFSPQAALVQGHDGNFYGTTSGDGIGDYGTVFKITPYGALTTLVSFNRFDGDHPAAALIQGRDGSFYGTTEFGGGQNGSGTIFKITTDGTPAGTTLTTLVIFSGSNGYYPTGLVQGHDGSIYGTTSSGGGRGAGTVFKLTPAGVLTTLVNFNIDDGDGPTGPLVQGKDGNFYGTTLGGGSPPHAKYGTGTVFKMTPDGVLTTLINFSGSIFDHLNSLILGRDGSFYGTTYQGGDTADYGYGTVFKLTTDGTPAGTTLTTLVTFTRNNGAYPAAPLVQGNDGSFYGTLAYGPGNFGKVFKVTTDGTPAGTRLRILVKFNGSNGQSPLAPLIQATDGNFYGTTAYGGSSGAGTIFKLAASTFAFESLTFLPSTLVGGSTTTGVVALNHLAVGPTVVTIISSNPVVLSVPTSVTITPSHRHAVFTAFSHPVATPTDVTLTVTSYGVSTTSIVRVTL